MTVQNASGGATPSVIAIGLPGSPAAMGEASLTFHRYGSDYFLAEIWDGYTGQGRSIWMSRTERETANRASLVKPEVVMVLARANLPLRSRPILAASGTVPEAAWHFPAKCSTGGMAG